MMAVVKLLHVSNKYILGVRFKTTFLLCKKLSNEVKEQMKCHCSLHKRVGYQKFKLKVWIENFI